MLILKSDRAPLAKMDDVKGVRRSSMWYHCNGGAFAIHVPGIGEKVRNGQRTICMAIECQLERVLWGTLSYELTVAIDRVFFPL